MSLKTFKNRGGRGDPQKYRKSITGGKSCESNISFSMNGETICLKDFPCSSLGNEDVGKKLTEMIRGCNKEEEINKENEKTKKYCNECKKTDGGIYFNTDGNNVEYHEVNDNIEQGKGTMGKGKGVAGKGKGKGPPIKGGIDGKGKGKGKGTGGGLINISPKIYTTSEQGELKCVSDPPKFNFPIESLPGYNDIDDYGLKGEDMKKLKWGRLIKRYYQNQKRWDDVSKITKDLLISIENRYSKKIRQYENPIKLEKSKKRQKEVLARIKEINSLLKSVDSDSSKSDLQQEREQLQTELVNLMKEIPELEKENRTLFPQKANFKKDKKEQQVKTSNIPEEYLEIPSKYKPAAPELMGLPKKIADNCPERHKTIYLDKNTINDLQIETKSPVEWEGGKDVSVRNNDFNKENAFNQRELGVWCLPDTYLERMECSNKVPVLMKQAGIKQKCSFKKRDAATGGKKSKKK